MGVLHKSRKADDYKEMLREQLYHPPSIEVDQNKSDNGELYLNHHFEGKPLVTEFISNTMMGIEYLWGAPVQLETSEIVQSAQESRRYGGSAPEKPEDKKNIKWKRVLYTMKDRKLTKKDLE